MPRTTQPYRAGGARAPSLMLDRMTAGKKLGAPGGNALASAVKKVTSKSKRTMPRY